MSLKLLNDDKLIKFYALFSFCFYNKKMFFNLPVCTVKNRIVVSIILNILNCLIFVCTMFGLIDYFCNIFEIIFDYKQQNVFF